MTYRRITLMTLAMLNVSLIVGLGSVPYAHADVRINCKGEPAAGVTAKGNPAHFNLEIRVNGTKVATSGVSTAAAEDCSVVLANIRGNFCPPLTCTAVAAGPPGDDFFTITDTPQGDPNGATLSTDDNNLGDSLGIFSSTPSVKAKVGITNGSGLTVSAGTITLDVDTVSLGTISTVVAFAAASTASTIRASLLAALTTAGFVATLESAQPTLQPIDLPSTLPPIVISADSLGTPPTGVAFIGTNSEVKAELSAGIVPPVPALSLRGVVVFLLLTMGALFLIYRRRSSRMSG